MIGSDSGPYPGDEYDVDDHHCGDKIVFKMLGSNLPATGE